jgi:hypothetical protein
MTAEVSAQATPEDLWTAYEAAQRHYESDLNLFNSRMSLFLVVQSALIAFVAIRSPATSLAIVAGQSAVPILGVVLCVAWLLVAVSSVSDHRGRTPSAVASGAENPRGHVTCHRRLAVSVPG